jgi:hypothetical protein
MHRTFHPSCNLWHAYFFCGGGNEHVDISSMVLEFTFITTWPLRICEAEPGLPLPLSQSVMRSMIGEGASTILVSANATLTVLSAVYSL